ncbi:MAG: hypothetical protein K0Q52_371 [Microbacterium sp.]|nr:hypothetical protein [Microbacterium sp.]
MPAEGDSLARSMGSNPTVTATTKAPNPLETLGCGAFVLFCPQ